MFQNEKRLLAHSRKVNNVAKIRAADIVQANRKEAKKKHIECSPKRMREDEQWVQDLVSCIDELDTFPLNLPSTALHTLQLAISASGELVADFKSAHAAGEETLAIVLQERVFSKQVVKVI